MRARLPFLLALSLVALVSHPAAQGISPEGYDLWTRLLAPAIVSAR